MPNPRFPRQQPADNVVINGAVWNALVDQVEKLARISVAPPLYLSDNATGKTISLTPAPPAVTLKILDYYATGSTTDTGGGRYKTVRSASTVSNLDPASNLSLPDASMTFGATADSIWVNLYENGALGSALVLKNSYVTGYYVGNSTNADSAVPLPVFYGSSAPSGTTFRVKLVQNGGSGGDATTAASWTYDVSTFDNSLQLASALAPEADYIATMRGSYGTRTAATAGFAYLDATGVLVLSFPFEFPGTEKC